MRLAKTSFPKENRLRKSYEFLEIFKKGRSVREKNIALYFRKKTLNENRFGIVVSRKAMPRAVDRNRVKRVTREFFRLKRTSSSQEHDIVIRLIGPFKALENKELRSILEILFTKAGLV